MLMTDSGHENTDALAEPLFTALAHIEKQGSLVEFLPDRIHRLRLTKLMAEQKLVAWNHTKKKYELTVLGRECVVSRLNGGVKPVRWQTADRQDVSTPD